MPTMRNSSARRATRSWARMSDEQLLGLRRLCVIDEPTRFDGIIWAATRDVARELGKQAAKEHFEMLIPRNERAS